MVILSVLFAFGCDDRQRPDPTHVGSRSEPQAEAPTFCGGELNVGVVESYFDRLAERLRNEQAPMSPEFFDAASVGDVPSLDDWREISRRGHEGLRNAGWRGCFLASGKAAFVGSGDDFTLKHFSRGMAWD